MSKSTLWLPVLMLAALLSAGCTSRIERADRFARRSGFTRELVEGERFRHVIFRNDAVGAAALHIYIEGDGTPYFERTVPAADPTPRLPLMLRLMAEDPARAVYLGRPCYFGLYADRGCDPSFWTSRRFSPEVLDSMEVVLRREISRTDARSVTLFGHSGGAAIAILLAERVSAVARVVTIGANLDTAAWCRLHGYLPLVGSLNPVEVGAHREGLEILHLVGQNDTNTPPALVQAAARRRGGERVEILPAFDHHCCWEARWPTLLSTMKIEYPVP